jgi:hypothetical protein
MKIFHIFTLKKLVFCYIKKIYTWKLIVCQVSFYFFSTCFLFLVPCSSTPTSYLSTTPIAPPCGCSLFACFFIVYLCCLLACVSLAPCLLTCALHDHRMLAYVSPICLHVASLGTHLTYCSLFACCHTSLLITYFYVVLPLSPYLLVQVLEQRARKPTSIKVILKKNLL